MSDLERYTPEICAQLRHFAEMRQWHRWDATHVQGGALSNDRLRSDVLEDVELTYHLHLAAEASGMRAGMPAMPPLPLKINLGEKSLDPAEFILNYRRRHSPWQWNQLDNHEQTFSARA